MRGTGASLVLERLALTAFGPPTGDNPQSVENVLYCNEETLGILRSLSGIGRSSSYNIESTLCCEQIKENLDIRGISLPDRLMSSWLGWIPGVVHNYMEGGVRFSSQPCANSWAPNTAESVTEVVRRPWICGEIGEVRFAPSSPFTTKHLM